MKKMIVSLGMSAMILLSAAFAQPAAKKASAPTASATTMVNANAQLSKKSKNSLFTEKFSINESQKMATTPKHTTIALKHVATYAAADPTKAKIKLVVGEVWDDGTGYQVLLDKDAKLCDEGFEDGLDQTNIRKYYDAADYTIPANATREGAYILDNESDSTEIEPGVYDVLVVNPTPDEDPETGEEYIHVYIASGADARLNDFDFEAGYTYVFEMTLDGNYDLCTLITPYDLEAEALELPILSCQVEDEVDVKLTVFNKGEIDMNNFEIWYTIAKNDTKDGEGDGDGDGDGDGNGDGNGDGDGDGNGDGNGDGDGDDDVVLDTIRMTITTTLKAGEKATYTFDKKVKAPAEGELCVIYAGITPSEKEHNIENNVTASGFTKHSALSEFPHNFDLTAYEFIPTPIDAWEFDVEEGDDTPFALAGAVGEPLVSRCLELEGGKTYRLSYEYLGGFVFWFWAIPDSCHIGFGKISDPMNQWNIVYESEPFFFEDWESNDVLLQPEEDGTYAFYFSADMVAAMGIRNIMISEVMEKDARLNAFKTGLARLTPVEQANGKFTATASVQNRGSQPMSGATVEVKLGGNVVGTANVPALDADKIANVNVALTVSGLKIGDKAQFKATVKLEGEPQAALYDNTFTQEVEVSDYVMAYDYVTENMYVEDEDYAIGNSNGSIACGIPFTLVAKDTLTAVSLGWIALDNDLTVGIQIHKWNSTTNMLGDMIFETSGRRGTTAGQRDYEVPALILEAGEYMISAVQTTNTFFALMTDHQPGVGLYVTSVNPPNYQNELGTPAIRAVFGPGAKPKAKDIFVQEITKPKATGLFAENQEVTVNVVNLGYDAVTAPLSLTVNGKLVSTKEVEFSAYGRNEVSFETDLSAPSTEYILTVYSSLAGDEDLSNDTVTKTVNSLAPADPYTMDFEYCEDFALEDFIPAWKTVDMDGSTTFSFGSTTYPNQYEPLAFIAFNPTMANMPASLTHGGERLGISFSAEDGPNNDWLISPKLKITPGKEYMKFFVKSYNSNYGLEQYNVLVSTTDDQIESFNPIGETREAPAEDWQEVTIDLKEYSGKDVYLAIQCISDDIFAFMIDDITVCGGVANEAVVDIATQLSIYPNPAQEMITIHAQDAAINQVAIFNVTGMMVYQSNNLNTTDYRYSVSNLNSGIYFARVTTDKGTAVMKFVVR